MIKKFYLQLILTSLCVTQPLFNIFSLNLDFFVGWRISGLELVYILFLFYLFLPLSFYGLILISFKLNKSLGKLIEYLLIVILSTVFLLQLLKQADIHSYMLILAFGAGVIGILWSSVVIFRKKFVQNNLSLFALATLAFPIVFLLDLYLLGYLFDNPVVDVSSSERKNEKQIKAASDTGTPVFIIVYDELALVSLLDKKGVIDRLRFPNISDFSKDAVWYQNAETVSQGTPRSVASIASGIVRKKGVLATYQNYPNNIFSMLGASHALYVVESNTSLCPEELVCQQVQPSLIENSKMSTRKKAKEFFYDVSLIFLHITLPNILSKDLRSISFKAFNFRGAIDGNTDRRTKKHNQFIALIKNSTVDKPSLFFMHNVIPHVSWMYKPSGKSYFPDYSSAWMVPGIDFKNEVWVEQNWLVVQGYQRHLLQTMYVDTMFGEILSAIKNKGLYDDALIVLTADHGVSFWPGKSRRDAEKTIREDIYSIPFIIKYPENKVKGVSYDHVTSTDIVPTIFDVLGIQPFPGFEGNSLMGSQISTIDVENSPHNKFLSSKSLTRKLNLFGDGDYNTIYQAGPLGHLVGKKVGKIAHDKQLFGQVHIKNSYLYENIRLKDHYIPSFISGIISLVQNDGVYNLALAVNGEICAVTETYLQKKNTMFDFLVADRCFINGKNDLTVYRINNNSHVPELSLVFHNRSEKSDIVGRFKGEIVELNNGEMLSKVAMNGEIGEFIYDPELKLLQVFGWAGDDKEGKLAKYILYSLGDDLRFASFMQLSRKYEGKTHYNPKLNVTGFAFELSIEESLVKNLQIVAVDGNGGYSILPNRFRSVSEK